MGQQDLLADVLEFARREGALEGEALEAFLTALRERAEVIVAQRLEENEWRRESMAGLEAELREVAALPITQLRQARRRLLALADALRREVQ
jgi:hypothetical protein